MIYQCSDRLILVRSKDSIHAGLSDSVSPNYLLVLFFAFSEDHNENLLPLSNLMKPFGVMMRRRMIVLVE